jgi:hypothetical protein
MNISPYPSGEEEGFPGVRNGEEPQRTAEGVHGLQKGQKGMTQYLHSNRRYPTLISRGSASKQTIG